MRICKTWKRRATHLPLAGQKRGPNGDEQPETKKALPYDYDNALIYGALGRARTADLVINSHPIYRLSYQGSM